MFPNLQHFEGRRACWSSRMGLGWTHNKSSWWDELAKPKKKGNLCKLNESGVVDLVGTTLNISFTQPTTFGRRHHSPPYSILYAFPWGLRPNVTFVRDSQVGVLKLGLLLSQNFGCSYLSQIKSILKMQMQYFIILKNIFPTLYNTPQSELIWPLLSRGLWSRIKFPIWFMALLLIITHAY